MNQESIIKIQMMEQEANHFNEQLQMIEQNIKEMQDLKASLEEIDKKENKEILANIGKKIYIPVEIKDKNLIVEVGRGHYVKKTVGDTSKVVEEQINKLSDGKIQIMTRLEELQNEMMNLIGEIEKEYRKEGEKNK
ncbi:MAG: prefoldin subunit alpha [archaeon]